MKSERKTISSRQLDLLANNPRTITKESLERWYYNKYKSQSKD